MTRPRFLADNDLNDAIVRGVERREPGIEFARLRELGLEKSPDREVLEYAARERWLVVSHDVNTMTAAAFKMLEAGQEMRGLLLVHQGDPIATTIESIMLI